MSTYIVSGAPDYVHVCSTNFLGILWYWFHTRYMYLHLLE